MKTINKKNLLKLAMMSVAMFMFTAAMGQTAEHYQNVESDVLAAGVSYITVNKTMPFYVDPDPLIHPNWAPFNGNFNGVGYNWIWDFTGEAGGITINQNPDDVGLNYVEVVANTIGDYTLNVRERAPAAFGNCVDPDGTDITVRVVAAPTIDDYSATIPDVEGGEDAVTFDGDIYTPDECGPLSGFNASVNLTGFPNFEVQWALIRQEIDINGDDVVGQDSQTVANGIYESTDGASITRGANSYVFDANREMDLIVRADLSRRTKYTYTISRVTDLISRKSDYLNDPVDTDWYGDAISFSVIVTPAPVTGPIYHIPNNFSL